MKINLRNGFFRIWIVSSIIWVGIAGWLSFTEAQKQAGHLSDSSRFERAYELEFQSRSGVITERKKEIFEEAVRRGIVPRISFVRDLLDKESQSNSIDKQLQMSVIRVEYLGKLREFPAGTNSIQIWQAYKPDIRNKKIKIYSKPVGWAFIPPLVILFLGLVVAWVFRGFVTVDRDA